LDGLAQRYAKFLFDYRRGAVMHGDNRPFRLHANARIPTGNFRQCPDQMVWRGHNIASRAFARSQRAQTMVAEAPEGLRDATGKVVDITSGNDGKRAVQAVGAGLQYWRHAICQPNGFSIVLEVGKGSVEVDEDGVVRREREGSFRGRGHALH